MIHKSLFFSFPVVLYVFAVFMKSSVSPKVKFILTVFYFSSFSILDDIFQPPNIFTFAVLFSRLSKYLLVYSLLNHYNKVFKSCSEKENYFNE
jgi:hypothetical protein